MKAETIATPGRIRDRAARPTSWTYRATRLVARVSLRGFYRRIAAADPQHMPSTGPVLVVANHPNYIIDALAIGTRMDRQLHFVARGPLLDRYPLLSRFLRGAGAVPVFRPTETPFGKHPGGRTAANRESLARCADLLEENGVICMFAEGESHPERQVRELRSGTARIVLEAEHRNDYALGVQVVPAGLYFPQVDRYFSDGVVAFGAPIDTAPFLAQHRHDTSGATRAFTAEIQARLRDLALHVPDPEWVACVEQVADFAGGWPERTPDAATRLRLTREISAALQAFVAADPEAAGRFRRSADVLWIAADAWDRHGHGPRTGWARLQDAGTLPIASLGYAYNMPPYLLLRAWIALFVKSREKRAFLKFLIGLPLFGGWYALSARWLSGRGRDRDAGARRDALRWWPIKRGAPLAIGGTTVGIVALRMRAHRRRWLDAWLPHNAAIDAARAQEISDSRRELLAELAPWRDPATDQA